jgi:hypothetical protein
MAIIFWIFSNKVIVVYTFNYELYKLGKTYYDKFKIQNITNSEYVIDDPITWNDNEVKLWHHGLGHISNDALLSSSLDPLEGPSVLGCGKLELGSRSRLPALKRGRGAC